MMKDLKKCLLTTLVDSLLAKYAYLDFYYTGPLAVLDQILISRQSREDSTLQKSSG